MAANPAEPNIAPPEQSNLNPNAPEFHIAPLDQRQLNPEAREWSPGDDRRLNYERRCLFITFSKSFPLTEHQVFDFFNGLFGGPMVEEVYLKRPRRNPGQRGSPPVFGKVVFASVLLPCVILGGLESKTYFVDSEATICCKRFRMRS